VRWKEKRGLEEIAWRLFVATSTRSGQERLGYLCNRAGREARHGLHSGSTRPKKVSSAQACRITAAIQPDGADDVLLSLLTQWALTAEPARATVGLYPGKVIELCPLSTIGGGTTTTNTTETPRKIPIGLSKRVPSDLDLGFNPTVSQVRPSTPVRVGFRIRHHWPAKLGSKDRYPSRQGLGTWEGPERWLSPPGMRCTEDYSVNSWLEPRVEARQTKFSRHPQSPDALAPV
jgi:hypothetical protein